MNSNNKANWLGWMLGAVALIGLTLWGCRKEPTSWTIDLHLPVVDAILDWGDVFADERFSLKPGQTAILNFEGEVARLEVADLASIPDTTVTNDLTPDFVGGPIPVPPGSVLLDEDEDIVFDVNGPEFKMLTLDNGLLKWKVSSTTDGYVELNYLFPGVQIQGLPVSLNLVLPPAPTVGGRAEAEGVIDITGATVDFRGVTGLERNKIASHLTIGTPENVTDTAQVYGTDSIVVAMTFTDMEVLDISGYFDSFEVDLDQGLTLFDSAVFASGLLALNPTRADLRFENGMAADLRVHVSELALGDQNLSHPVVGTDIYLARADWSQGAPPAVDGLNINLLETSPSFFSVLGTLPDSVHVAGQIQVNPLGDISGGNDYFHKDFPPRLLLDLELPMDVAITGLRFRDTLEIAPTDAPDFQGVIELEFRNGFPVDMNLSGSWQPTGTTFDLFLPAGNGNASTVSTVAIPVNAEELLVGGEVWLEAGLATDGYTTFSGNERIRVRARVKGTHNIVIE